MDEFLFALTLPPVSRGLLAMAVAGLCFPASGVMVLRLNLIPMRYMLMHGVILGGAISLALSLPLLPVSIALNLLLVLIIALVVAMAMKLLGALLIDALLILPVLVAAKRAVSLKQLLLLSCLIGLFVSTFGFLLAIATDLPPSGTVALLSALLYLIPTHKKGIAS